MLFSLCLSLCLCLPALLSSLPTDILLRAQTRIFSGGHIDILSVVGLLLSISVPCSLFPVLCSVLCILHPTLPSQHPIRSVSSEGAEGTEAHTRETHADTRKVGQPGHGGRINGGTEGQRDRRAEGWIEWTDREADGWTKEE